MIEVLELKKHDEKIWDEFVHKSNDTTFYHQIAWKYVIKESYGFKPIYLIAEEKGEIRGILPLFLIKSRLFGRKLISVPFAPYGGACADNMLIERCLIEESKELADKYDVEFVELRYLKNSCISLPTFTKYYTFILKLEKNPKVVWQRFSKKVRNSTRKAIKLGLEVERNKDYINEFYKIYSKNMHYLGTPTHSKQFFKNVLKMFSEQTDLVVVKYKDKIIAGTVLLYFKDTVISGWAGSLREYLSFCPNNLMYWEIIKDACENGYKFFDFGRSLINSGTFKFKKAWATEPIQLKYHFYLPNSRQIPDISMQNPKRKRFAEIWRKIPYPIANVIGPKLRKFFP